MKTAVAPEYGFENPGKKSRVNKLIRRMMHRT